MTTLWPCFETTLRHGDHAVTLRASLRAAVNIDNLDGGLPAVWQRLARQNYTTIRAVIRAAATDHQQAERFLSSLDGHPLRPFLHDAQAACLELFAALLPAPDDKPRGTTTRPETNGKPLSDYFGNLYAHATGWMNWTPNTAWNASPAEIEAAFAAHVDRLIAMNGGKRDDKAEAEGPINIYTPERLAGIEELGHDPAFQRDKLRALKARMG